MTPDGLPVIGRVPAYTNALIALRLGDLDAISADVREYIVQPYLDSRVGAHG